MTDFRYNPFWDYPEHQEYMSKEELIYCEGYSDGYAKGYTKGSDHRDSLENLERYNSQLENLLSANVRVMKAEIFKELKASGQIPETATLIS